jgi:hypothetical protein
MTLHTKLLPPDGEQNTFATRTPGYFDRLSTGLCGGCRETGSVGAMATGFRKEHDHNSECQLGLAGAHRARTSWSFHVSGAYPEWFCMKYKLCGPAGDRRAEE